MVTRRRWEVPGLRLASTAELLRLTGQLSVRQLGIYHTLLILKKVLLTRQPEYVYTKLVGLGHTYSTSRPAGEQAGGGLLRQLAGRGAVPRAAGGDAQRGEDRTVQTGSQGACVGQCASVDRTQPSALHCNDDAVFSNLCYLIFNDA